MSASRDRALAAVRAGEVRLIHDDTLTYPRDVSGSSLAALRKSGVIELRGRVYRVVAGAGEGA